MIPSQLDFPPPNDDGIFPEWANDFADTFNMLFVSQTWRENTKWANFFDKLAQRARCAYVEEGLVILGNCYYKLYKDRGIETYDQYVEQEVRKSKWQCKQLMEAATVGWHLLCQGFEVIPTCVSQAITLLECVNSKKEENVTLVSAWKDCLRIASGLKKNITAKFIRIVVGDEPVKETKNIKVDVEVHKGLCKEAHKCGLTLNDFLTKISKGEELEQQPEPTPPEEPQAIEEPEPDNESTEHDIIITPRILLNDKASNILMGTQDSKVEKLHEIHGPEPPF